MEIVEKSLPSLLAEQQLLGVGQHKLEHEVRLESMSLNCDKD